LPFIRHGKGSTSTQAALTLRLYSLESLKTTLEMVGFGRQMDAAINWTLLVIDLNPSFLNFDREDR
jgi:hypothetical protein